MRGKLLKKRLLPVSILSPPSLSEPRRPWNDYDYWQKRNALVIRDEISGTYIFRIKDNRIAEVWNHWDQVGEWQQLGILLETTEILNQVKNKGAAANKYPSEV